MDRQMEHKPLIFRHLILPIFILFFGASAPAVEAQEGIQMVRTLVIKDNKVLIDGEAIESDALPKDVNLDGVSISYSFVGIDIPLVTLGSTLFAVEKDRLKPIESREARQSFVTEQQYQQQQQVLETRQAKGWIVDYDRGEYYTFQGERLEAADAVPRLLKEANTLYLEDLQKENQRLFTRLTREQELESEAEFLAMSVRRSTDPQERIRHVAALTAKLNEIFDLKQQNRRDEISQFERELHELKRRVDQREELRENIIEQRVARLTGNGK